MARFRWIRTDPVDNHRVGAFLCGRIEGVGLDGNLIVCNPPSIQFIEKGDKPFRMFVIYGNGLSGFRMQNRVSPVWRIYPFKVFIQPWPAAANFARPWPRFRQISDPVTASLKTSNISIRSIAPPIAARTLESVFPTDG